MVAFLGSNEKLFSLGFSWLIEKSKSISLAKKCSKFRVTGYYIKRSLPTMKEKANLSEGWWHSRCGSEPLFHNYLQLIFDIYTEPTLRRSDLTTRLEHPFLLAGRARDGQFTGEIMDLLDASIPRSLYSRCHIYLGCQSWEALADYNWIYLALHLLLGTVDSGSPLKSHTQRTN